MENPDFLGNLVCVCWGGGSLNSSGSGQIPGLPRKLSRATCIQDLKLPRQGWQRAPGQVTACESLAQLLLSPTLPGRNASLQGQKTDLTTGGRRLGRAGLGKPTQASHGTHQVWEHSPFCGVSWVLVNTGAETGPGGKTGQGHFPFQVGSEGISANLKDHSPCPSPEDIDIILEHSFLKVTI